MFTKSIHYRKLWEVSFTLIQTRMNSVTSFASFYKSWSPQRSFSRLLAALQSTSAMVTIMNALLCYFDRFYCEFLSKNLRSTVNRSDEQDVGEPCIENLPKDLCATSILIAEEDFQGIDMILDVQGFKQSGKRFIPKELATMNIQADEEGNQGLSCILFKPPCPWEVLPSKYKSINAWLMCNYHGLPWNAGVESYDDVKKIVMKVVEKASRVYVKGREKKQWVESVIDYSKPVIDLADLGCPKLSEPEVAHCWYHGYHMHTPKYHCAFENVERLRIWYQRYCSSSLEKSLRLFFAMGALTKMTKEDIAFLPKNFIIMYAANEIDEVWDKLPENIKMDKDVAGYRRCRLHTWQSNYDHDTFDGPNPLIKNCAQCKIV